MTLQETLVAAAGRGNRTGITFLGGPAQEPARLSYAALLVEARAMARWLRERSVSRNQPVLLSLPSNRRFVTAFWGCLFAGAIPAPIAPVTGVSNPRPARERLANVRRLLGCCPVLIDEPDANLDGALTLPADLPGSGVIDDPAAAPDDLAFIQFSSGSTGAPKGVALTHANVLANLDAIHKGARKSAEDVAVGWTPLHHDLGLVGFLLGSIHGAHELVLLEAAAFVRRPLSWLDALQQYRGTLTAAPNFGQTLVLARLERAAPRRDLSSVRVLVNGAEPIAAETMTAFLDALEAHGLRRDAMFPVYGLAEATLAVSFPDPGTEPVVEYVDRHQLHVGDAVRAVAASDLRAMAVVCEGRPVRSCEIRIVDANDVPLPDSVAGHVHIRGAAVTRGYYADPVATSAAFTADGWLRTGDLGFFHEGRLFIAGREKDVLFVNGQNFYATDIEAIVRQVGGMERGRVAAVASRQPGDTADRLVLFVAGGNRPGDGERFDAIRHRLQEALGLIPDGIVPIPAADFPRTTSGKLQRGRLRERYEAGEWTAWRAPSRPASTARLAPRTPDERRVHAIWTRELGLPPQDLGVDDRFDAAGGTSLTAAAIAAALEDAYGGVIPPHLISNDSTVEALAARFANGCGSLRLPGARKVVFRG